MCVDTGVAVGPSSFALLEQGEKVLAVAMSEPEVGSDLGMCSLPSCPFHPNAKPGECFGHVVLQAL